MLSKSQTPNQRPLNQKPSQLNHQQQSTPPQQIQQQIQDIKELIQLLPSKHTIYHINPKKLEDNIQIITKINFNSIIRKGKLTYLKCTDQHNNKINLIFFHKIFTIPQIIKTPNTYIQGQIRKFNNQYYITHPTTISNKNIILLKLNNLQYKFLPKYTNSNSISYTQNIYNIFTKVESKLIDYPCKHLTYILKSLKSIHFPQNTTVYNTNLEILANIEIAAYKFLQQQNMTNNTNANTPIQSNKLAQQEILTKLKITLTPSQQQSLEEIEQCYQRILQGDVGSGKTIIALLSMINFSSQNLQTALICPTSILAEQHYTFFTKTLQKLKNLPNIKIILLTSKTKNKKQIHKKIAEGFYNIIIGTHAVFETQYKNLSFVVIDEQHRFGVSQRFQLNKENPNLKTLVMTATPIPRTLYLALFQNIPISYITHKIHNTQNITTTLHPLSQTNIIIKKLTKFIAKNEAVFWICPLISESSSTKDYLKSKNNTTNTITHISESSENTQLMHAEKRFKILSDIYPEKVGLLHGKSKDKTEIMQKLLNKEINILVATTVIEVGIHIPQATCIIIENAENFGLATLHQLRGRVGRSKLPSFCLLLHQNTISDTRNSTSNITHNLNHTSDNNKSVTSTLSSSSSSNKAYQRLSTLKNTTNGLEIAKQDLEIRGKGNVFGQEQSGAVKNFIFFQEQHELNHINEFNCCIKHIHKIFTEIPIDQSI